MTDLLATTNRTDDRQAPPDGSPDGHHWEEAGEAWGARALDWACLFEHYATDVLLDVLDRTGVGDGTQLLDVACGSGLAVRMAHARGAAVAGIDAAQALVEVARRRTPEADVRVGTMFELPWDDERFDVVTSINGIWGGCEAALEEAARVLRPGGHVAISFWGEGPPLDLRRCFRAFAANAPADHLAGMKRTNGIARPGVAEAMLTSAGLEVLHRGSRISTLEWPDAETAWRALASIGPAVPALRHVGADALRPQVLEALEACRDDLGMYRFHNDQQYVIARKAVR